MPNTPFAPIPVTVEGHLQGDSVGVAGAPPRSDRVSAAPIVRLNGIAHGQSMPNLLAIDMSCPPSLPTQNVPEMSRLSSGPEFSSLGQIPLSSPSINAAGMPMLPFIPGTMMQMLPDQSMNLASLPNLSGAGQMPDFMTQQFFDPGIPPQAPLIDSGAFWHR
jgi:hypothetical protein